MEVVVVVMVMVVGTPGQVYNLLCAGTVFVFGRWLQSKEERRGLFPSFLRCPFVCVIAYLPVLLP